MFTTPKEIHVEIVSRLNSINSNRTKSFRPEEIDSYFNTTMLKFIEERSIIDERNFGLNESVKRYDNLKDLQVVGKPLDVYVDSDNEAFCILPENYYKFQALQLNTNFDCIRTSINSGSVVDANLYYHTLEVDMELAMSAYSNFRILYSGGEIYDSSDYNINFNKIDSIFILINNVLEVLNSTYDFDVYWERFNDIYVKNSFIIINNESGDNLFEIYIPLNIVYSIATKFNYSKFNLENTDNVPTELVSSKDLYDIKNNFYQNKNRHKKPLLVLDKNYIKIDYTNAYIPITGKLIYIKKPILLNLSANIMTDFRSNIDQIIDLTVENMALVLTNDVNAKTKISNKNLI